jgi:hypothetical protein
MNEEVYVERTAIAPRSFRRVSWGAIFAGLFVTVVIQLTLTLLGAAVGLVSVDLLHEQNPGRNIALGSGIWLLVSGLVSIWIGACVAGRLAGADGLLHGIVTWSVSTCVMLMLLATTAGALLGGTGALLAGVIRVGDTVSGEPGQQAALGDQIKAMFPQTGSLLPPTGRTGEGQPQPPGKLTELAQQDSELAAAVSRMEANGGAVKSSQDRDRVQEILISKQGMEQAQAAAIVDQWDQQFQQLKARAEQASKDAGQTAARGISRGALWGFIALLLGLLAAAWGGWNGTASLAPYTDTVVKTS